MRQKHNANLQKKISEVEKLIESILQNSITTGTKRKILDELQRYKARLIARNGDEAEPPCLDLIRQKPSH